MNFTYGFQTYSRLPAKYDTWVIRKLVGNRVTSDISNITITGEGINTQHTYTHIHTHTHTYTHIHTHTHTFKYDDPTIQNILFLIFYFFYFYFFLFFLFIYFIFFIDAFKMDLSAAGRDIQRQGVTHELVEYWGSGRVVKDLEKSIE